MSTLPTLFYSVLIGTLSITEILSISNVRQAQAQVITQRRSITFSSQRSDSGTGISQDCKYFFYEGGDFRQTCSSLIDSGYTQPRTRTSEAAGYWESNGSTIRVIIERPANLSGQIIYQKSRDGVLISPSGIRLYPD